MSHNSLRKKLLLWLSVPMLVLIAIDSSILYSIAKHFQRKTFDHELASTAYDVSQLIKESTDGEHKFFLNPDVRKILLSNQDDQMFYSIVDETDNVIGGDQVLQWVPPRGTDKPAVYFGHAEIGGKMTRVAVLRTDMQTTSGPQRVYVQVAETLKKRERLERQILLGIVVPQLILLLAAAALLWFGIYRGLMPLSELNNAVTRRSHRDLSPVQLSKTPDEVHVLVNSINSLMSQLEDVLASQNRFIADAAHQLRTPLAGMQAQLELAQDETDPAELQVTLSRISISMQRLVHMVNQLLRLACSQPEANRRMEMKPLDLNWLAQQATISMVPAAYKKEIDLGFEGPDHAVNIEGEAQRLNELLNNLIDNALRYTQAGGKVTVKMQADERAATLCVEDNGPGIPPEEHERVFERFHRIMGNQQEGSGLGLAIVKEIAQIHHAVVSIETAHGESGTRICVRFPLLQPGPLQSGTSI